MAQGKKSFTAYCDWILTFESLSNEEAGILIKHILQYVNDKNPQSNDPVIKYTFPLIQATLKRDLKKWEEKKEKDSLNGRVGNLKRWHKDLFLQYEKGLKTLKECEIIAVNRQTSPPDTTQSPPIGSIADSVSVSVSVRDSVSVSEKKINDDEEKNPPPPNSIFSIEECKIKYLSNKRVLEAVSENIKNKIQIKDFDKRLKQFNQHLLENSIQTKEYSDYCSHFLRWHKKTKTEQINNRKITL